MSVDHIFMRWIDESIGSLNKLRQAPGLDGQIKKIEFSIQLCNIKIKDAKTLEVEVVVQSYCKQTEYASLLDYWVDVKPRLQADISPGLKAKESYELLYAVLVYDCTQTPQGNATPQRARVQAALEGLIEFYTGEPAKQMAMLRYEGRDKQFEPGSSKHVFYQSLFLTLNKDALHALLFSQPGVIKELDLMADELAKGGKYRKTLVVNDGV